MAATIAIVLALAGSAYAGAGLGARTVGTRQLKNHSVTTKKIADEAVTERKLSIDSVGAFALKDVVVRSSTIPLPANTNVAVEADCPGGEVGIGGGGRTTGSGTSVAMEASYPTDGTGGTVPDGKPFSGWTAFFHNTSATSVSAVAYVLCLPQ